LRSPRHQTTSADTKPGLPLPHSLAAATIAKDEAAKSGDLDVL
jgi:hypothetical protein